MYEPITDKQDVTVVWTQNPLHVTYDQAFIYLFI